MVRRGGLVEVITMGVSLTVIAVVSLTAMAVVSSVSELTGGQTVIAVPIHSSN